MEKGSIPRWEKHQPILSPTDADFETLVICENGSYFAKKDDTQYE